MNRTLLEEMLIRMKKSLKNGKDIGDLKIGALFALGNQLEAIFYFIGHELGSKMEDNVNPKDLVKTMGSVANQYHLGKIEAMENSPDHISFRLDKCGSCNDLIDIELKPAQGFCSFEAGVFAGIVEKITGKHCFAQETSCSLENRSGKCEFIIVIPQE